MKYSLAARRSPAAWITLLTVLRTAALLAQSPETPADSSEIFAETVDVNLVNVEVMVTDKKGVPIAGLSREDFEVYEDGRPVEITNFYARQMAMTPAPKLGERKAVAPGMEQPPHSEASTAIAPPEDQRLNLVVFIDNFNVRPLDRNRVLGKVRTFLFENVRAGDRVMLVSYNRSIKVERPLTSDLNSVSDALSEMESISGHRSGADAERRDLITEIERSKPEERTQLVHRIRQHAQSLANDLAFTIDGLKNFLGPLSGLPGRKAILHVSNGFPMIPAEDLFYAVQQRHDDVSVLGEIRAFDVSRRIEELAAAANANRVTFYAIDASGLRAYGADGAERKGGGWETIGPEIDSMHVANLQSPIRFLADATGGLAVFNTNDIGPGLRGIGGDFSSYYSLGFEPAHRDDGRYHKVEVRVLREDLLVRHRSGYRAKSVENQMVDGTTSALLYGVDTNPARVTFEVETQERREEGLFLVTLLIRVPFDRLTLVPQGEQYRGQLRVFVSVMDEKGAMSPVERSDVPVRIPAEYLQAALGDSLTYETSLVMRPGRHRVAIGLRDDLGYTDSFVTGYVAVGAG